MPAASPGHWSPRARSASGNTPCTNRLQAISNRGKQHGAIHHQFYSNLAGDEVLVVDEWPDAESFQRFFEASPDIGEMMGEAGVTNEPRPEFWQAIDTPDRF